MKKTLTLWLVLWFSVCAAQAQRTRVEGIVKDSLTGEGLPYAAVIWENSNVKTATDINGRFSLSVPNRKGTLLISYMGYHTREINLSPQGRRISLDIPMADADIALDEVTVKPKRERYRRRDNPAVEFVRRVIESRDANDPKAHDFYSYDHYEKILFAKRKAASTSCRNLWIRWMPAPPSFPYRKRRRWRPYISESPPNRRNVS